MASTAPRPATPATCTPVTARSEPVAAAAAGVAEAAERGVAEAEAAGSGATDPEALGDGAGLVGAVVGEGLG